MTIATTTALQGATFGEVAELRDDLGVLSIYVDTGAEGGERSTRAGEIALRGALADLRETVHAEGPRERRMAVDGLIEGLNGDLVALTDPARSGRARALFVGVSGGEPLTVSSRHHMGTGVTLASTPHLMPLLPALEAEQPFGVIAVSGHGIRALDMVGGDAVDAAWMEFDFEADEWRRMAGPASANPANARTTASQQDLFRRRVEAHRRQGVAEAVAPLAALARAVGWTRVLLAGEPTRLAPLADGWPDDGPALVVTGDRLVDTESAEDARRRAEPVLTEERRREQRDLVQRALDAALGGAAGAAGPADVIGALQEGRVDHLLIDADLRRPGSVTSDGRLVPEAEVPAGVNPADLVPEDDLSDRVVQRALATDASITALEGAARDLVSDHGGIAALLRW